MVDLAGDIQFLRQMMQGRDGAGGDRGDFDARWFILSQTKDVFAPAEVSDHAESRFTVLAEGFDDAVVAVAVGLIGLERCHQLGIYTKTSALVKGSFLGFRRNKLAIITYIQTQTSQFIASKRLDRNRNRSFNKLPLAQASRALSPRRYGRQHPARSSRWRLADGRPARRGRCAPPRAPLSGERSASPPRAT